MKIIRVFPRKTNATPTDDLVAVNRAPYLWEEADEVHISVAFSADMKKAETLARYWAPVGTVKIGGPALDDPGGDFISGKYLKPGYTITSRGCPNHCWFCDAWRREGRKIRTLPIVPGFNVLDNNLLACPRSHVEAVFDMLATQKDAPRFTGGLEAAILQEWQVIRIAQLHTKIAWFAYDTPDDYEPLRIAASLLNDCGLITSGHGMCCYVLCGWKGDSFASAEKRFRSVVEMGLMPQAMLLNRGSHFDDSTAKEWKRYARTWANKVIVGAKMRQIGKVLQDQDIRSGTQGGSHSLAESNGVLHSTTQTFNRCGR